MKSYLREIVLPSVSIVEKPSYTVPEVQRILGISKTTIYRWIRENILPIRIVNNRVYFKELEAYFSQWDIDDDKEW